MPVDPLFPDKYPRGTSTGTVAILCEGDVNCYEADFLEKWASITLPSGPVVHVWPCGTGSAVRGMADAIGRTVRIAALLDRDFHDPQSIEKVKKKWSSDAEKFGWSFLGVRMWARNEIENYFLDDDILLPVMMNAFGCSETDVSQAVNKAVKLLVHFQALQYAFHKARSAWEDSDPQCLIGPSRPQWGPTGLEAVDANDVQKELMKRLEKWRIKVSDKDGSLSEPWKGDTFLSTYNTLVERWSSETSAPTEWREIWAGKEVLKLVRQQLASQTAGWWSADEVKANPVAWSQMKNNRERDTHDRKIENQLRPAFVDRLVTVITSNATDPRRGEFDELASILSS